MEFIRRLLKFGGDSKESGEPIARGAAPVQTQEEQDATRVRMEAEMADQRDRRESNQSDKQSTDT